MQVVSAERAWGERFFFDRHGELMVAEGVLPPEFPGVVAPETAVLGTNRVGHIVKPGDLLVTPTGEDADREYKVVPLSLAGVFLDTDQPQERGVITAEKKLIPLVPDVESVGSFLEKIVANYAIGSPRDAKRLARQVGEGHQFLTHFHRNNGMIKAYVEYAHPDFVPLEEPSRLAAAA